MILFLNLSHDLFRTLLQKSLYCRLADILQLARSKDMPSICALPFLTLCMGDVNVLYLTSNNVKKKVCTVPERDDEHSSQLSRTLIFIFRIF